MKRNHLPDGAFADQTNHDGEGQMAQANPWDRPKTLYGREAANHAPILTPEEARQGDVSGRVRLALTVSLTLTVTAGAIVYAALV